MNELVPQVAAQVIGVPLSKRKMSEDVARENASLNALPTGSRPITIVCPAIVEVAFVYTIVCLERELLLELESVSL